MLWLAIVMAALFAIGGAALVSLALGPAGTDHPIARRLPVTWRAAWPWIESLAPIAGSMLSWRSRKRLANQLLRAGLAVSLSPGHVAAGQWLGAALGALVGAAAATSLSDPKAALLASCVAASAACGATLPRSWLRAEVLRRAGRMARELPFLLDMTTLCVESGLNLQGALQQAAQHGPSGPLRDELHHALADMRAGMPRLDALRQWAGRVDLPGVHALTVALAQADTVGMSLGPLLRAQSERRRAERFHHAEKLAMQAPVKMLFPLICCIFPCTFIVLAFPIAVQLWQALQ